MFSLLKKPAGLGGLSGFLVMQIAGVLVHPGFLSTFLLGFAGAAGGHHR